MGAEKREAEVLEQWDAFVESRGLPYFRNDHQLMMRQLLQRYPLKKLTDLSDRDLYDCINTGKDDEDARIMRSFRYFLSHFDRFLERWDLERQ